MVPEAVPDVLLAAKYEWTFDPTKSLGTQQWTLTTQWASGYEGKERVSLG